MRIGIWNVETLGNSVSGLAEAGLEELYQTMRALMIRFHIVEQELDVLIIQELRDKGISVLENATTFVNAWNEKNNIQDKYLCDSIGSAYSADANSEQYIRDNFGKLKTIGTGSSNNERYGVIFRNGTLLSFLDNSSSDGIRKLDAHGTLMRDEGGNELRDHYLYLSTYGAVLEATKVALGTPRYNYTFSEPTVPPTPSRYPKASFAMVDLVDSDKNRSHYDPKSIEKAIKSEAVKSTFETYRKVYQTGVATRERTILRQEAFDKLRNKKSALNELGETFLAENTSLNTARRPAVVALNRHGINGVDKIWLLTYHAPVNRDALELGVKVAVNSSEVIGNNAVILSGDFNASRTQLASTIDGTAEDVGLTLASHRENKVTSMVHYCTTCEVRRIPNKDEINPDTALSLRDYAYFKGMSRNYPGSVAGNFNSNEVYIEKMLLSLREYISESTAECGDRYKKMCDMFHIITGWCKECAKYLDAFKKYFQPEVNAGAVDFPNNATPDDMEKLWKFIYRNIASDHLPIIITVKVDKSQGEESPGDDDEFE